MKILMFFHGGSTNRGCEAIVRSAIHVIKNEYPDAIIDLASMDPESDKGIDGLNNIIPDGCREIKKYSLAWFKSVIYYKFFGNESVIFKYIHSNLMELIPNYDCFLSIGGDNYCYGEQPWLYVINKEIKKANKKLFLWGASIGEEDLSSAKIEDLKLYDKILARETLTYNILKNKGLKNIELVADGAFTMQPEMLPLPSGWTDGNMIGFNYSPLILTKNPQSKLAALDLVNYIINNTNLNIIFTPHVIQPQNNDYECLLEFYNKFKDSGRVIILPNNLNAIQYKGYISRMRFFIGARTHATIAAYSSCVPTMVLGYSIKSKGIAKDIFGTEKLVLNIEELSNQNLLIAKFKELLDEEIILKEILIRKIPEIKKMSYQAAKYLQ